MAVWWSGFSTIVPVDDCDQCGADLGQVSCTHERRTRIDIIFEKVVEHVEAEIKQCPSCARIVKGKFPVDMPGPLQYGLGVQAFIINLLACQMVALKRAQALVYAIIDVIIAEDTMLQFILRLHAALESWGVRATEKLLLEAVMHVDETSLRVDKTNYWIHVHSAGGLALRKRITAGIFALPKIICSGRASTTTMINTLAWCRGAAI